MNVVDTALLALVGGTGLTVYDGLVKPDISTKTVEYPTPYLTFMSSVGDYHTPRLDARPGQLSVYFTIQYVGLSREQAKGAGEAVRTALIRKRVNGTGITRSGVIRLEESQRVRRDDNAIRPDGTPLFYGVDNYAVSVTLNAQGVPA